MWSDQCLEVERCSSTDVLEGQHHRLELDASCNRKSAEVTEERGHMGEERQTENKVRCRVLDTLQWFSHRGWESSQERVAVVQVGDDQRLGQELHCILFEARLQQYYLVYPLFTRKDVQYL